MGLSRSSSGLLVYDAFGSDTTANYSVVSGVTKTISGGHFYLNTNVAWAVHTGTSGANCVTAGVSTKTNENSVSPVLSDNGSMGSTNDYDGYFQYVSDLANNHRLLRVDNGGATVIGTDATAVAGGTPYAARVYRSGNSVIGKSGTTALSVSLSITDTTYTTSLYAGLRQAGSLDGSMYADWFDARTSHLITCSGLPTGYYLKVSDGATTAKAAESSGTASVDAGAVLFPLASVGVYDGDPDAGGSLVVELDTGDYADMGGGDAFAYTASGTSYFLPGIMQCHVIPSFLGGI